MMFLETILLLSVLLLKVESTVFTADDMDMRKFDEAEKCMKSNLCEGGHMKIYDVHLSIMTNGEYPELSAQWFTAMDVFLEAIERKCGVVAEKGSKEMFENITCICKMGDEEAKPMLGEACRQMFDLYQKKGCNMGVVDNTCDGYHKMLKRFMGIICERQVENKCPNEFSGDWFCKKSKESDSESSGSKNRPRFSMG